MNRNRLARTSLTLAAALALTACGGGGDDDDAAGGGGAAALSCDTSKYVAGAVEKPSDAQIAAYAGTYDGDEGAFGPNPGDPFVKSASAAVAFTADGSLSYKGTTYPVTSVCVEKAAGALGTILYVIAGTGHIDFSDKVDPDLGRAWGVSPADGRTLFRKGLKR